MTVIEEMRAMAESIGLAMPQAATLMMEAADTICELQCRPGDASDAMPTKEESSGTCHADETETFECVCDGIGHYGKRVTIHVMECSACGGTYEHMWGNYEYCPHCRRKVVGE